MAPPSRNARLAAILTAALLVASVAAFVRGWLHSEMFAKIAWYADGGTRAALLSGAYWLIGLAVVASGRRALAGKFAVIAAIAIAACVGVLPVLAAAYLFVSACALGYGILSRNGRLVLPSSDLPLATALGLGVIGSVLVVLGLWPVNTPFTYFFLLALPLLWQSRAVFAHLANAALRERDASWRELLLLGAVGNFALLNVTVALLPEIGNDALAFHLGVAAHIHDFASWHYDVQRALLAVVPLAVNYLYAAGYMFGGEMAARLVNVGALLTALGLVHAAVRGFAGRTTALAATLLAVATPMTLLESASLFVDNAWSLLVAGSFVAFLQFAKGGDSMRLVAGGLLFGAALAAKLISTAALPGVALMVAMAMRDRGARFPWGTLALAVAVGLALAVPPYLIAFVKTGNPVFPFMNDVFKSSFYMPASNLHFGPSLHPLLPYRMTFYTDQYLEAVPGAFGFTVLLLGPAVLVAAASWGKRDGVAMAFAALSFALVVVANVAYVRYVYPALFPFAIAFGAVLGGAAAGGWAVRGLWIVTGVVVVANVLFLPAGFTPSRSFELAPIVDADARRAYISKWASRRHQVPLLNALPDQDTAVAFFGGPPFSAQIRRRVLLDSGYTFEFLGRVGKLRSRDDLVQLVHDFDLGYIVLNSQFERRLRPIVESAAKLVAVFEDSTVYRIDTSARFPVKLTKGEGMAMGPADWIEIGRVSRDAATGTVRVNEADALYQRVPIEGGKQYRYAVTSRCGTTPGDVRLQVIWHRPDGSTSLSYRPVGCLPRWNEEEAVFTAPADAVVAVVFAIGHTATPVEIRDASLQGRLPANTVRQRGP